MVQNTCCYGELNKTRRIAPLWCYSVTVSIGLVQISQQFYRWFNQYLYIFSGLLYKRKRNWKKTGVMAKTSPEKRTWKHREKKKRILVYVFADVNQTCVQEICFFHTIYLSTAIGLSPGGSSTVHIYTQTVQRTTPNKQYTEQHNNLWECGPCPVLAKFTLAFALQLRKKHEKTSVRVSVSKNT